ncbi:MAG TPA: prephenate dehydrogenase/arogenate dehydrogenase family protein [Candidatus Limnocylindria bacterium]|nr:prephenate dehydrogenase/arogenate dehydrogenase family protein [Candidatus Limnocylindria bacterium]
MIERLGIVGVGLIGGSLGLAARERGLVRDVVGYGRRRENLELAVARGAIDQIAESLGEVAADADVVVLAAPVGECATLARALRSAARAGTILTDVGSVKRRLVAELEAAWGDGAVVGGHPIAGSEQRTVAAARADLFVGRRCVLTPTERTDPQALATVRRLWEGVGALVEEMDPERHDALLARVSHAPHLVAYALVDAVAAWEHGADALARAGSGFVDTTRVAGSAAELWRDILLANAPAVLAALGEFRQSLARLEAAVAAGDAQTLDAVLERARAARERLGGTS